MALWDNKKKLLFKVFETFFKMKIFMIRHLNI